MADTTCSNSSFFFFVFNVPLMNACEFLAPPSFFQAAASLSPSLTPEAVAIIFVQWPLPSSLETKARNAPPLLYFSILEKENFLFQVQTILLTCNSKVPSWSTADKQLLRTFSSFSLFPRRNLCQARVWGKTQIFLLHPFVKKNFFLFSKVRLGEF